MSTATNHFPLNLGSINTVFISPVSNITKRWLIVYETTTVSKGSQRRWTFFLSVIINKTLKERKHLLVSKSAKKSLYIDNIICLYLNATGERRGVLLNTFVTFYPVEDFLSDKNCRKTRVLWLFKLSCLCQISELQGD